MILWDESNIVYADILAWLALGAASGLMTLGFKAWQKARHWSRDSAQGEGGVMSEGRYGYGTYEDLGNGWTEEGTVAQDYLEAGRHPDLPRQKPADIERSIRALLQDVPTKKENP